MKRAVFYVLVFSVVLNAALGIYALLAGEFGQLEEKILYTSLAVSAAGVLALACGPAWERGLAGPLPRVGVAATLGSFVVIVVGIWSEASAESFWRTVGTLVVVAVTPTYGCLLALARLAPR